MSEKIPDHCPEWADKLIHDLRDVEIFLGNLPKKKDWESNRLADFSKRVFASDAPVWDEAKAEKVFAMIVSRLHSEGFSDQEIADFINARIRYDGGPKFCDAAEVRDAIGDV